MSEAQSMTDESAEAWATIDPVHQIQRMTDWANMLEERVKELDPMYRTYPWGRKEVQIGLDQIPEEG